MSLFQNSGMGSAFVAVVDGGLALQMMKEHMGHNNPKLDPKAPQPKRQSLQPPAHWRGRRQQQASVKQSGKVVKKQRAKSPQQQPHSSVTWHNMQFIGDSNLSRVLAAVSLKKPRYSKCFATMQLGLCLHGHTICQMSQLLKGQKSPEVMETVVLMLGTNDLVKKVPLESSSNGFKRLLSTLKAKAKKVIVFTVPPVPRLLKCDSVQSLNNWKNLNKCILDAVQFAGQGNEIFQSVDLADHFLDSETNTVNASLFKEKYESGKEDNVHLNDAGVQIIINLLKDHI